ncbi:MAG: recombinase family protein [Gemmatimonadaceae bacterium]|nr:recombinase family protein [Gemmatimonadaceae bacterium]
MARALEITWQQRLAAASGELPARIRYTRKSSEQEDRQVTSFGQQIEAMDKRWGSLSSNWCWQDSKSGKNLNRPALTDLRAFCRANPRPKQSPGHVEIYDVSRLGRPLGDDGKPDTRALIVLEAELEAFNWKVRYVTTEKSGNSLHDTVNLIFETHGASSYLAQLKSNIRRGKRSRAANGFWTHSHSPFGTNRAEVGTGRIIPTGQKATPGSGGLKLVPNEEQLAVWEKAARQVVAGNSLKRVCEMLYDQGVRAPRGAGTKGFGHSSLKKLLTNRALIGEVLLQTGDGDVAEGSSEKWVKAQWSPMVDMELFNKVCEVLAERGASLKAGSNRKRSDIFPLRPICAHCGLPYTGGRYSRRQGGARAYTHPRPGITHPEARQAYDEAGCKVRYIVAEDLETRVKDAICSHRLTPEFMQSLREVALKQSTGANRDVALAAVSKQVTDTTRRYQNCYKLVMLQFDHGEVPADDPMHDELRKLRAELSAAKDKLKALEASSTAKSPEQKSARIEELLQSSSFLERAWSKMSIERQKALFDYWVDHVLIVVDEIPGYKRANLKTAIVDLAILPNDPVQLNLETGARYLRSAASISSSTSGDSSSNRRCFKKASASGEPILPSDHAKCRRNKTSASDHAATKAGTSPAEPVLPSTMAALRRSPERFARFMADPRNNSVYSETSIPSKRSANSRGGTPSKNGRGRKGEPSSSSLENLRLYGHTSLHTSQP